MGSGTTGVHSTLRNTLMVEVLDLLAEDEVLEESGTTLTSAEAVLVGEGTTNVTGQVDIGVVELKLSQELVSLLGVLAGLKVGMAGGNIACSNIGAHVGATDGGSRARKGGGESNG